MPLSAVRLFDDDRLKVPSEHLGLLVEPDGPRLEALLDRSGSDSLLRVRLLDRSVGELRASVRAGLRCRGPLIATGHQPELFHAGVFAKLIAAALLAEKHGGAALFVMVDSDLPKQTHLVVPQVTSRGLRRVEVAIPGIDQQVPYEFQPRAARTEWLQFFASAASLYAAGDIALLPVFARAWLTTPEAQPTWCEALSRASAAAATALALKSIAHLRLSDLCRRAAFRTLAASLILDAERVASLYNAALVACRRRHRVGSVARPMPALTIDDQRIEVPLWVVRADQPRRRLYVSRGPGSVTFYADQTIVGRMSPGALAAADRHGEPWPFAAGGWELRPRAVTLSLFLRMLLADVFIHGIGGARYDEVTEEFALSWLGVPLPALACVSATLRLPLPCHGVRRADIARARQAARDLRHNPQRHLRDLPAELVRRRGELVRRSDELRQTRPHDHAARRRVFREIRQLNDRLLEYDPWRAASYDQRIQTLLSQAELDRIALDREYFYALHPQSTLAKLVEAVRHRLDR